MSNQELYETSPDFKRYVDRHCKTYNLEKEEAMKHELVNLAAQYYMEENSGQIQEEIHDSNQ